jgi:hypothetical protein
VSQPAFSNGESGLSVRTKLNDSFNELYDAKGTRTVYVNNFGAVGDGTTHPLSERYASLEAAQTVYPHATALTDEIDWCAWQAASDWLYDNSPDLGFSGNNWSVGRIKADGRYVVNKSIVLTHCSIIIEGVNGGERYVYGGATSIKYNGPDGADDNHIAILDFYGMDEVGDPPAGKYPIHGQGIGKVYHLGLFGKGGSMTGAPSASGYIWGIRFRNGSFCEVAHCNFGGTLYDGIVACSQMFTRIYHNFFFEVHRDAISILGFTGDFSTTVWIDDNEFGYVGRYAILQNYNGAIEPAPSVRRNSFEHVSMSTYYFQNPEWFVQGLASCVCQIGGTFGQYSENRFEGCTGHPSESVAGLLWADFHFISVGNLQILNNRHGGIAFAAYRDNPNRTTAAYASFMTDHNYCDITNTRNFHAGDTGDFLGSSACADITVDGCNGFILNVGGVGLSNGTYHNWRNSVGALVCLNLPVVTGTYIEKVEPNTTAIPSMMPLPVPLLHNALEYSFARGPAKFLQGNEFYPFAIPFGTWAAATAYRAIVRTHELGVSMAKKWVIPATANGYFYECTVAGTSAGSAPTWPTTPGATVTDGGVTWKCVGTYMLRFDNGIERYVIGRRLMISTAAPSSSADGYFSGGDRVLNQTPEAAGVSEWVCTSSGLPGTWKTVSVNS